MPLDVPNDTAWKVTGAAKLHWRCWDGDYVVFNPLSGDTHLLEAVAGRVLMDILASPATTDELILRTADFLDVETGDGLSEYVKDVLSKLDELGLIEPVRSC